MNSGDALIVAGLGVTGAGLFLLHWPLVLVLAGLVLVGVGWRRLG